MDVTIGLPLLDLVSEGNIGEYLKFLPGVTIDYTGGNARDISLNGVPANNVPIDQDLDRLPPPDFDNLYWKTIDEMITLGAERFAGRFHRVITLADDLEEMKTICACARKASMNMRVDAQGRRVKEGDA